MGSFHPLKVLDCGSDTQLKVGENLNRITEVLIVVLVLNGVRGGGSNKIGIKSRQWIRLSIVLQTRKSIVLKHTKI